MPIEIGMVEALFRYPVKSMRGERLESATLGWHGLEGDRRLAFRRTEDRSGFPWLSASKLPELILFTPERRANGANVGLTTHADLPTHVCTPSGATLPVFGKDLAGDVEGRFGAAVRMTHLKHGIFDDASISVIASDTVAEIARLAGQNTDVRRFRPNILVHLLQARPFEEDNWLGGELSFGDSENDPAIAVTQRDVRCSMLNLDPDSARPTPETLKAVVRVNDNNAGVYATVTRIGVLTLGQSIYFRAPGDHR